MNALLPLGALPAGIVLALAAEVRLPALFGDHLVLQRECRARIWGWAEPEEAVEVRASWASDAAGSTVADAGGRWQVELETPAAGGPFELEVRGKNKLEIRDVLVGEVWIASGQSNMEMTLAPGHGNGVAGWEEAVCTAHDPELRFFDVENAFAPEPAADCNGSRGGWRVASAENAGTFSACAYFFARRLRAELGLPVGVITADWGGTRAEAWTSAGGLAGFPEFTAPLAALRRVARDPASAAAEHEAAEAAWWRAVEEQDPVSGALATLPVALDELEWSSVSLPITWEAQGLAHFDGLAWYRREITLPAGWAGKDLVLELGPIYDRDTTWWNGERLGDHEQEGEWQTPSSYRIPGARVHARNALAVRVLDTGGVGGFAGSDSALRVYPSREEGQALSLAGSWLWRRGPALSTVGAPPRPPGLNPNQPSALWNAMVAPLVAFAMRGVIWYQGESNCERAEQYRSLFPALIRDWRARFGQGDFPFYFVQIAPFAYKGDSGEAARLRDAQREALALPHTGMAVTMDVGDRDSAHPLQKREVGERLALWALARTYGRAELECSGPLYRSMRVEGGAIRIEFEHAAGLTSRGAAPKHATIAGAERVFHPAEVRIEGETLLVSSPEVQAPLAVRYGWGASDAGELWNGAGLPASSFRTDDWE